MPLLSDGCGDDIGRPVLTYGFEPHNNVQAIDVKVEGESYTYLMSRGEDSGDIIESIIGRGGTTFMKSTFTILHSSLQ